MIITLKHGTTEQQMNEFIDSWKQKGFDVHISKGKNLTILGLLGDTSSSRHATLRALTNLFNGFL